MKFLTLSFFFSFFLFSQMYVLGQQNGFCIVDKLHSNEVVDISKTLDNEPTEKMDDIIYVRTVFHILHHRPEQNFSDEQIYNLMDSLNMLFSGLEVDTAFIHPQHRSLIHDTKIRFCLASIDPEGHSTNGITRTPMDTLSHFPIELDSNKTAEHVKTDSLGGKSPWDTEKYFNIWIAPMENESANSNYGSPLENYFPLGQIVGNLIPGAVIDTKNLAEPNFWFHTPGVLAHECGHALGLMHIFGLFQEDLDFCGTDDFMDDTPNCGPSFICVDSEENSCIDSIADKFDNNANIMNYACMRMITPDQSAAMRSNLMQSQKLWMTEDECNAFVSTKNQFIEDDFKIYPNPNDGRFYIDFPIGDFQEVNVSIFNIHGKKEFSQVFQSVDKGFFNLDERFKGLYFLKMEMENRSWVRKVFIK